MSGGRASKTDDRHYVYGRRVGRPLSTGQLARQARLLPSIRVALPANGALDPKGLFAEKPEEVWLEIGFGGGEHLAALAQENTDIGFIGSEPFVNGVAQLLKAVEANDLSNLRIFDDDARLLLARLAPASITRIFILFPDPWPKKRHHKRRFISPENLDLMAAVLAPGGKLGIATDQEDYLNWILRHLLADRRFAWLAETADDWRLPPYAAASTRYARKAMAGGGVPSYLSFRRSDGSIAQGNPRKHQKTLEEQ